MQVIKNLSDNVEDVREVDSAPRSGTYLGEGFSTPLQYSFLENPKDRGDWRDSVHRVIKSQTQLK